MDGDITTWPLSVRFLFPDKEGAPEGLTEKLGSDLPVVPCQEARNPADISTFTREKMLSAWKGKLINKQLFDEAQREVEAQSMGNFLWTSLVVEELASLSREDVVRERLEDLPKDLPEAMVLTLQRLSGELDTYDLEDLNVSGPSFGFGDWTLRDTDASHSGHPGMGRVWSPRPHPVRSRCIAVHSETQRSTGH